ncbi:MAG: right-handed parallel beta-helix repeat-containing protein [Dysgonomonas sp.]
MKISFKNYITRLFFIVFASSVLFSCSNDDDNGNSNGRTLIVDNSQFGIYANKTNAEQTTKGINTAIEYAKDNGYDVVKLTRGEYLIKCMGGYGYESNKGIFMPNNLTLDMTDGVTLYVEPNSVMHKLIWIDEVENVTILGGHLIGDKDSHKLNSLTASGGNAIEINCSRNVTIQGVKMEKFTGSAMWVGYGYIAPNERRLNKNIKIQNCDISDSWMQGISIVHASGMEIANNKIYGIGGVEPGCGIDIEPEADWSGAHPWKSWVENVNIHHNEFKDTKAEGVCVVNSYSTDIEVADNLFDKSAIIINRDSKRIRLVRNTTKGWESYMVARTSEDVYMPLTGPNKNNVEFAERVANCSTMTGYITETDNYTKCD